MTAESTGRLALGVPWWLPGLAALGVAAVIVPKLAFAAAILCLIGGLSLPERTGRGRAVAVGWLIFAVVTTTIGVGRFVLLEALPGVIAGGRAAVEKQAVAKLRGIVNAQDHARRTALSDPDGDGVGSALSLAQLGGFEPIDGRPPLSVPPLAFAQSALVSTRSGQAIEQAGYLFQVCLPDRSGAFVASADDPDSERAETEYFAYAWPARVGPGSPETAYFTDAREGVLELRAEGDEPRYQGRQHPPPCDAALSETWPTWRDKEPRQQLPGAGAP